MALIVAAFVEIQRPASPHPAAARLSLHYADIGRLREMGFVCLTGVGVLECWSVGDTVLKVKPQNPDEKKWIAG